MILFKRAADINKYLKIKSKSGDSLGFVPTMGALHAGHISLLENSKKVNTLTVCSIFVNPTQFNDPKDFAKYPVTPEKDILALEQCGCDILFLPSVEEIYPQGITGSPVFDLGYLETILEGSYRPGHFQGVCQVMSRLLEIVMPDTLYLGQKDYQQCMVIKRLIALNGWPIQLTVCATLRENTGLALSSRNMRLTATEKEKAAIIFKALQYLAQQIKPGEMVEYKTKAEQMITEAGFEKIDYVSIADADTLEPITIWNGQTPLVALVAAFLNGVRLIDNMRLINTE